MKTKNRTFRVWTYDVWGNADDGYDVNDRYSHGLVTIKCKAQTFNAGTDHEFTTFEPTDRQLSRALGVTGCEWDGSDGTFYAMGKKDSYPAGQLDEYIREVQP